MDNLYFKLKNDAKQIKHNTMLFFDVEQKRVLNENREYKGKYQGKRCFIVGNGPSLQNQDLSKIKDEMVFTVNMFPKSSMYGQVKSDFHVMMDPYIFQLDLSKEENKEKLEIFKKINTADNQPICFFPYVSKNIIEEHGVHRFLKISYLGLGCEFYENYNREFDLTKHIPGFYNVVQYAIEIAIYMGFKEIYLLGCDMTGYECISVLADKEVQRHAYDEDEDEQEKEAFKNHCAQIDLEKFFWGFHKMFADYKRLYIYTKKREINLYNATYGGVLESLPRVDYNKLFQE